MKLKQAMKRSSNSNGAQPVAVTMKWSRHGKSYVFEDCQQKSQVKVSTGPTGASNEEAVRMCKWFANHILSPSNQRPMNCLPAFPGNCYSAEPCQPASQQPASSGQPASPKLVKTFASQTQPKPYFALPLNYFKISPIL